MEFICHIKDFVYPPKEILQTRDTARGIIFLNKKIALMHVKGKDDFGTRDHFETPGGGIEKGESPIGALKREILEELGYTIKNIIPIGVISNDYHLIKRCDRAHYFVAQAQTLTHTSYTDLEKKLFEGTQWLESSSILEYYKNTTVENVGKIIHKRDAIAIERALSIFTQL